VVSQAPGWFLTRIEQTTPFLFDRVADEIAEGRLQVHGEGIRLFSFLRG
jgi:hypothetical protein